MTNAMKIAVREVVPQARKRGGLEFDLTHGLIGNAVAAARH